MGFLIRDSMGLGLRSTQVKVVLCRGYCSCLSGAQEFRNKELNNGRFAMFAALGIISADLFTGKDAMQQFGL